MCETRKTYGKTDQVGLTKSYAVENVKSRVKRTIKLRRKGVNWMSRSERDRVVGCCQHGNERLTFAKGGRFHTS